MEYPKEDDLTGLEVAKMILIYEMMLKALVDKGNELVPFMVPCYSPRARTKQVLDAISKSLDMKEEDKAYYRDVITTADRIWLDYKAREIK